MSHIDQRIKLLNARLDCGEITDSEIRELAGLVCETEATIRARAERIRTEIATSVDLVDVLKENISPHCMAAIASCLSIADNYGDASEIPRRTRDEVRWFRQQIIEELGGAYNALLEEIGH